MTLAQQRRGRCLIHPKHTFHSHLFVLHELSLLPYVLFCQINCCWGGGERKQAVTDVRMLTRPPLTSAVNSLFCFLIFFFFPEVTFVLFLALP